MNAGPIERRQVTALLPPVGGEGSRVEVVPIVAARLGLGAAIE